MWNATINSTQVDDKGLTVTVDFTDGNVTFTKSFNTQSATITLDWIYVQVQSELANLNYFSQYAGALNPGDPVGVADDAVSGVTSADIEAAISDSTQNAINSLKNPLPPIDQGA